jgi:hypothetical protein
MADLRVNCDSQQSLMSNPSGDTNWKNLTGQHNRDQEQAKKARTHGYDGLNWQVKQKVD